MIVLVTPSDPFVENPTGVPGPMHIHWYRMTDGRVCSTPRPSIGWRSIATGHCPSSIRLPAFVSALWREECRHQTLDAWWEPLRYQQRVGEIDLPVLHISGWYDDEEIGTPANFSAMVAAGRSRQRLLMGPWGHQVNAGRRLGELDFGHDSVLDLDAAMTGFLDEMVRGRPPAEPPAPVRMFLMGANVWLDAAVLAAAGRRGGEPLPRWRRPRELALRRWPPDRHAAHDRLPRRRVGPRSRPAGPVHYRRVVGADRRSR